MRPTGKRNTPMRHGAIGIISLCRLEWPNGRAMIESVKEIKSLVKVFLRFLGVCRDLSCIRSQTVVERFRFAVRAETRYHQSECEPAAYEDCFHGSSSFRDLISASSGRSCDLRILMCKLH